MKYIKTYKLFESNIDIFTRLKTHLFNRDTKNIKYLLNKIIENKLTEYELSNRTSPSEDFENEYNIDGISFNYKIPFNLSEENYEDLMDIFSKDDDVIDFLFDSLIELNPILDNIKYDGTWNKQIIIGGVCSKMKIDDIEDYIEYETKIENMPSENNGEYLFVRKSIDKKYSYLYNVLYKNGIYLSYFPSIKTLEVIIKKLNLT
jgi:hypothetical protein